MSAYPRRLPAGVIPYECTGDDDCARPGVVLVWCDDDLWHYDAACLNEEHMAAALRRSVEEPWELPGVTWDEVTR